MRILITGAGGQLGNELVRVFGEPGHHDVVPTDRTTLDIENRDSILGAITTAEPDVIVHGAAWTAVDKCEEDQDKAFRANALGTRHIVDGADRVGARVIYLSTDYVFDGTLPVDQAYNEWHPTNPQSVYGKSKLGGESELRPQDTVVRTSWVFGTHGHNMVKTVLKLAEVNPELHFVNDQHGKPTNAYDLAGRIYELAVNRMPGVFHVTNEGPTTWFQFVRDVMSAAGLDPDRVHPVATKDQNPQRPAPRPTNSVLDNSAVRLQGLPLLADHREAIERTVKELQS